MIGGTKSWRVPKGDKNPILSLEDFSDGGRHTRRRRDERRDGDVEHSPVSYLTKSVSGMSVDRSRLRPGR